jgi:hypothetical protein
MHGKHSSPRLAPSRSTKIHVDHLGCPLSLYCNQSGVAVCCASILGWRLTGVKLGLIGCRNVDQEPGVPESEAVDVHVPMFSGCK